MALFFILLEKENPALGKVVSIIFLLAFSLFIARFLFRYIEIGYVLLRKKPIFTHLYVRLKDITPEQERILIAKFPFYKRLQPRQKAFFKHRLRVFMDNKTFVSRGDMEITEEVRLLISATAVMLTFGFRDFLIDLIDTILVYPTAFYSKINQDYHKGEFNPKLKALVLSWEDFKIGLDITNDNLNLGVHEFAHAIHLNSMQERDISSSIFLKSFNELAVLLSENAELKQDLIKSEYLRNYAYTNQYEFLAVIIENFIETPREFQSQFPEVYNKTKQMLNFNFAGY